ncbi:MAG: hypothetical protein JW969_09435 [Spirochaetales bacterium]|nr:hypothetical protein [Spirochaetales bacterium]
MNEKVRVIGIIARTRIKETLLNPALYVLITGALVFTYYSLVDFINAIDSDGLNLAKTPILELVSGLMTSFFGRTASENLFAHGPFLFTFIVIFFPFILYLSISTAFKLGNEKSTGACQLVIFGPVNITPYYLSFLIRDIFFTLGYIFLVCILFTAGSLVTNMVVDPTFFLSAVSSFFMAIALLSYGILASSLASNGFTSLSIYLSSVAVFFVLYIGSLMTISEYTINPATVIGLVLQVFSPFFYWQASLTAVEHGNWLVFLLDVFALVLITSVLMVATHFLSRIRSIKV